MKKAFSFIGHHGQMFFTSHHKKGILSKMHNPIIPGNWREMKLILFVDFLTGVFRSKFTK